VALHLCNDLHRSTVPSRWFVSGVNCTALGDLGIHPSQRLAQCSCAFGGGWAYAAKTTRPSRYFSSIFNSPPSSTSLNWPVFLLTNRVCVCVFAVSSFFFCLGWGKDEKRQWTIICSRRMLTVASMSRKLQAILRSSHIRSANDNIGEEEYYWPCNRTRRWILPKSIHWQQMSSRIFSIRGLVQPKLPTYPVNWS